MTDKELREAADTARREYQRNYQREWRRKNPERARAIQDRYWARKALEYGGGDVDGRTTGATD